MSRPFMQPLGRPTGVYLLTLCVVSLATKLAVSHLIYGLGKPFEDRRCEYVDSALGLLQYGEFVSPLIKPIRETPPSALMPPLYTVFVAAVFSALGRTRSRPRYSFNSSTPWPPR